MIMSVSRAVNLGVRGDLTPSHQRRIQTINFVALVAIGLNLVFSTIFFVLIDASGSWLLRGVNLLLVGGYVASMALNLASRIELAMWLVNIAGLANITVSSIALGVDLGSIAFFVVVPLTAALTSRDGDVTVPVIFTIGALIGLGTVVAIQPSIPTAVAGTPWQSPVLVGNVAGVVLFATAVALYYRRRADRSEADLAAEHARSERLLLNILPKETAERLKAGERVIADAADDVAVLFADLVGSTPLTRQAESEELVTVLDRVFSAFDDLADGYGLEKIKTMGDSYIAVAGLPTPTPDHLEAAADMALAMRREIRNHSLPGSDPLQLRIGLHTGSVIAGVIGKRKFSYDLWGDTVNIASRMESQGIPGEIQVTQHVRDRLEGAFEFESRGTIEVKGTGEMNTYLLKGRMA